MGNAHSEVWPVIDETSSGGERTLLCSELLLSFFGTLAVCRRRCSIPRPESGARRRKQGAILKRRLQEGGGVEPKQLQGIVSCLRQGGGNLGSKYTSSLKTSFTYGPSKGGAVSNEGRRRNAHRPDAERHRPEQLRLLARRPSADNVSCISLVYLSLNSKEVVSQIRG